MLYMEMTACFRKVLTVSLPDVRFRSDDEQSVHLYSGGQLKKLLIHNLPHIVKHETRGLFANLSYRDHG